MHTSVLTTEYYLRPHCGSTLSSLGDPGVVDRKPFRGVTRTAPGPRFCKWPGGLREEVSGPQADEERTSQCFTRFSEEICRKAANLPVVLSLTLQVF